MKYLLCSASFISDEKLIEHYIDYDKIDKDNKIFKSFSNPSILGTGELNLLKQSILMTTYFTV